MRKQYENNIRKGGIAEEIAILKHRREARKAKEEKKNNIQYNGQKQKEQDQKFLKMITKKKELIYKKNKPLSYVDSSDSKIFVVVRKRPIFQKEINNGEIDCISIINPRVYIHECKIQIDGITKYLEDHEFYFDGTFGEKDNTIDLYKTTLSPMINLILNEGIVTCFAYGQTGSGKTYTMKGLEKEAIDDLYRESKKMGGIFDFYVSFFEIYRGNLYDLLNNKNKVEILDDKNGKVHIYGLYNQIAESPEIMHHIIDSANAIRTTHNTVTNETSSRSHAICNIVVKLKGSEEEYGKLSLVDLAGSERAQETKCNDKERRAEGAEINKSLLALKECIRALDEKKTNPDQHVPFRASKLTHILRDSFVSKSDKSRIIMISCVTPSYTCCNHSLNTLRYSDRLKEKTKHHFGGNYNNINIKARTVNSNQIGNNNNIKSSYNIIAKNNSNNENSGNNKIKKSINQNLNSGSKSHKHQKSYTKENINLIKKANNSNKNNNRNTNKSKNKKLNNNNDKKSDIASQKLMKEIKKSHKSNYKKKNILKTKNTFKYEDKFCMMNEDDIDLQKRKKYNYDYSNNDFNNNTYNFNNNIYNKISQDELMNKNYRNESDGERDWNNISKKKEKENISHKDDDEENYYNDDEEDENSVEDNSNYEEEENIEQNEEEENDDNINESGSDNDDNYDEQDEHEHDDDENEHDDDNEHDNDDDDNDNDNDSQIEDDNNIDEELGIIGEDIINTHMVYLREAANILSEEGDLVTNIKGVGKKNTITLDEYISSLEKIVDKKLDMYGDIKGKIRKYKKFVKNKNGKNY
jgi:kinesin family protein 2/24